MNKKKILIIDDEVDIANNIKAILSDENYNTSIAHNSKDAFQQLSDCLLYTSPSPRDRVLSRMPSSA